MELAANTVHIWFTQFSAIPSSALASYRGLMNSTEQERNRRFKYGTLRDANTITRALLRTVLSQYDDCPPQCWEFAAHAHGRPYIASPATDLQFNLSHSSEWVVCAVSRISVIGVDIERCNRNVDVLRLARRFFSAREYRDVQACTQRERKQRFFDYWTLKESYIKARGEGISLGLDKFGFGISADGTIDIECDEKLQETPAAWQFMLSPRGDDHRLALAVKLPQPAEKIDIQHFFTIPLLRMENYTGPLCLKQ
jgi:4'-phosphopantetheinyl transferase